MSDQEPEDLGERIRRAQAARDAKAKSQEKAPDSAANAGALALRYGAEMAACVGVGLVLGLMIDNFLGTQPWGLLIMLAFGLAAGVLGVIRAYQQINADLGAGESTPDDRD
ncbi:MAG: AtpZ/AtpI family protein [Pseudomonadota bacterium]